MGVLGEGFEGVDVEVAFEVEEFLTEEESRVLFLLLVEEEELFRVLSFGLGF